MPVEEEEDGEDIPEDGTNKITAFWASWRNFTAHYQQNRSFDLYGISKGISQIWNRTKEKLRKTKLMHLITEAYSKNDLYELLKLRMTLITEQENLRLLSNQIGVLNFWLSRFCFGERLKDIQTEHIGSLEKAITKRWILVLLLKWIPLKASKQLEFHKQVLKSREYVVRFWVIY